MRYNWDFLNLKLFVVFSLYFLKVFCLLFLHFFFNNVFDNSTIESNVHIYSFKMIYFLVSFIILWFRLQICTLTLISRMHQKCSIFQQPCTIQRRLRQIHSFSKLDEFIVVKNPLAEQKRYEAIYDEVGEISSDITRSDIKVCSTFQTIHIVVYRQFGCFKK